MLLFLVFLPAFILIYQGWSKMRDNSPGHVSIPCSMLAPSPWSLVLGYLLRVPPALFVPMHET